MLETPKTWIRRFLRVPSQPEAPSGAAPESVRVFRAGRGYLRYRLLHWLWRQVSVLVGILLVLTFAFWDPIGAMGPIESAMERIVLWDSGFRLTVADAVRSAEAIAIAAFLIQLPFPLLMTLLDYEYRWYIVTDRSLRIREGLIRVEERTMTFSNIQNISVRQGPLQRWFGISDLEVRSAGGGEGSSGEDGNGKGGGLHVAVFRGIPNADEVRETIRRHLASRRESGLGDPDEPADAARVDAAEGAVEAARKVLEEVRALRRKLTRRSP